MPSPISSNPATALTVICQQAGGLENVTVMGVDSLDAGSRRLLETMTREVIEPRSIRGGVAFHMPEGCATRFAQTLASVLTLRGVSVRVA